MKFNINDYHGEYAMHCKTAKEARSFCDYLKSVGRTWCTGLQYDDTAWGYDCEDTVYFFNNGTRSDVNYAKSQNCTILEWEDFMNKTFTKADLKNGDIVQFDNGRIGIVITDRGIILLRDDVLNLSLYKDDMSQPCAPGFTIKAVRRPERMSYCYWDTFRTNSGTLIYDRERDTVVEMTMEEICAALGKNIKIVKEK
jgi:hypothetical protein